MLQNFYNIVFDVLQSRWDGHEKFSLAITCGGEKLDFKNKPNL